MSTKEKFQNYILKWYAYHGRAELPWRQTEDPYKILVSELMLQQTQVERVIPKYLAFIKRFPTAKKLATASLAEVLTFWQGLGYNRRAKFLHTTAQAVTDDLAGIFPAEIAELEKLPGIGPYTARAVSAFAFNKPVVLLETNVRAVFLYHFFASQTAVSDTELRFKVAEYNYIANPREWYSALMDYGTALKKLVPNPSRKSKHHTKQTKFAGSLRQTRGEILRLLSKQDSISKNLLLNSLTSNKNHHTKALSQLEKEGLIKNINDTISLGN